MSSSTDWANEIITNGWVVKPQPDFVSAMKNAKVMRKIVSPAHKARTRVIDLVNKLLSLGPPHIPKVGYSRWLQNFVQIREAGIQGDWRLLYKVTGPSEITIFCLANHKQVERTSRDSNARVHNSPMDGYDLADYLAEEHFEVDLTDDDELIEARTNQIISEIKQRLGSKVYEQKQDDFNNTRERCSIFLIGEHGLELKTTDEQNQIISETSPLLLPGVAGTGKSTVLQKRYVNALLSAERNGGSDNFFDETVYLTLNERLAEETRGIIQQLLPSHLKSGMERTILSLEEWSTSLLQSIDSKIKFGDSDKVTFQRFRKWWSKRQSLSRYDPAQAWEEYRGVVRGSDSCITAERGTLSIEEYVSLPINRATYSGKSERTQVYTDFIHQYWESLGEKDWDEQDQAREILLYFKSQKVKLYRNIFIDEVQDLTELQLKTLLNLMKDKVECHCTSSGNKDCNCPPDCDNCNCLIFDATGDISQQVYPSRFRWEDTSRLIYESLGVKCKLSNSLNTSYRSMRSIVDIANWYLQNMNDSNKQGLEIKQALSTEKGVRPSLRYGDKSDLISSLVDVGLPLSYCPLIVRDEIQKTEIREEIRSMKKQGSRFQSELYVYTIAEIKGLEYNYVLAWDISSGSDHILKRAHHELRGNYVGNEEWNLQMEYKHAFVAVTRTRELLHHLSLTNDKYSNDPLMESLVSDNLVIEQDEDEDLSHFANIEISDEELLQFAIGYENAGLYESAADIYIGLGKEVEAKHCLFKHHQYDESPIKMAEIARDLSKLQNNLNEKTLNEIHQRSMNRCLELRGNKKTYLLLELQSFHARKCGNKDVEIRSKAEHAELSAKENNKPFLWKKAAQLWAKLEDFKKAARAYSKCNEHVSAAKCYYNCGEQQKLRQSMLTVLDDPKLLKFEKLDKAKIIDIKLRLLVPILLDNQGSHIDRLKTVFGFSPTPQFKNLPADYEGVDNLDCGSTHRYLILRIDDLRNNNNPVKKARTLAERGKTDEALNIMREEGLFRQGLEEFFPLMDMKQLKKWLSDNKSSRSEVFDALMITFNEVDTKSNSELARYFLSCPRISRKHLTGKLSTKDRYSVIDCAIGIIREPHSISDDYCRKKMKTLLQAYVNPKYCLKDENLVILHAIRTAIIRVIHATDIMHGGIENISLDEHKKTGMYLCELLIKFKQNPRRCKDRYYFQVREIVLSMMHHYHAMDFVDCLFEWLLSASQITKWDAQKVALKDLLLLIRIYGDDGKPPNENFRYSKFRFPNGYSPEDLISKSSSDMSIPKAVQDEIETIFFNQNKGEGFMNGMRIAEDKSVWKDKDVEFDIIIQLLQLSKQTQNVPFEEIFAKIRESMDEINDVIPIKLHSVKPLAEDNQGAVEVIQEEVQPEDDLSINERSAYDGDIIPESSILQIVEPSAANEIPVVEELVSVDVIVVDNSSEDSISLQSAFQRFQSSGSDNCYEWIRTELKYDEAVNSGNREVTIDNWNDELREIIDDEIYDDDVVNASAWILFDDIRKELPKIGIIPSKLSDSYTNNLKQLRDKLVKNRDFWVFKWAQRILSIGN